MNDTDDKITPKNVFVISPVGEDGSDIRIDADFFLNHVVRAALPDSVVKRADDYKSIAVITNQIIQAIMDADLIVADLSGRNANVFYELGLAHTFGKKVVPMIKGGELPPFDNAAIRAVSYSRATYQTEQKAVKELKAAIWETMASEVSNPVSHARGTRQLTESTDGKDQIIAGLDARLARLEQKDELPTNYLAMGRRFKPVPTLASMNVSERLAFNPNVSDSFMTLLYGDELRKLTKHDQELAAAEADRVLSAAYQKAGRNLSGLEIINALKVRFGIVLSLDALTLSGGVFE